MTSHRLIPGRQLRLFSDVSIREMKGLISVSAVRETMPQDVIMREGQPADYLHIVLEGLVELFGTCGQRETTIDLLKAGDSFILAAVVKNAPYLMSSRSLTRGRILEIPGKAFRATLRRDQGLALATSSELSRVFRAKVRQLRSQKLRSAQMRLASYLLVEIGDVSEPRRVFLSVSKKTLASLMGLEPESLSRIFASLEPFGVEVVDNKIVVNDPCKLKELAIYNSILDDPD